jgi:hypothetical protein
MFVVRFRLHMFVVMCFYIVFFLGWGANTGSFQLLFILYDRNFDTSSQKYQQTFFKTW